MREMGEFNKAIVAVVMGLLIIVEQIWGFHVAGVSEATVTMILAVLTPILVFLVPNWPAARTVTRTP